MRIVIFISLVLLAIFLGSLFGCLYEQLTYTISSEFFTKLRFQNDGLTGNINERWEAAKIGIKQTWQVGLFLGILLTLAGLLHSDNKKMFFVTLQSFFITIITSFLFGILALFFADPSLEISNDIGVIDKVAFNKVIVMNNSTYVGGLIGMLFGIGWHIFKTHQDKLKKNPAPLK